MRILVISDIHANLPGLTAVLDSADACDAVWCLGDLVGYGPDPNECIDLLRTLPNLTCLLGNHDAATLGAIGLDSFNYEARASISWTRSSLTADNLNFLRSLPEKVLQFNVTLVHGTPRSPVWEYLLDLDTARENFSLFNNQICLVGHTHYPSAICSSNGNGTISRVIPVPNETMPLKGRFFLNPGSVGQPRDHDSRAAYAIFNPQECKWESCRVPYDIEGVQQRIIQAGLPLRNAIRLDNGW